MLVIQRSKVDRVAALPVLSWKPAFTGRDDIDEERHFGCPCCPAHQRENNITLTVNAASDSRPFFPPATRKRLETPLRWLVSSTLLLTITACAGTARETMSTPSERAAPTSYPAVDPELGERLHPEEQVLAEEISRVIERSLRERYAPGNIQRDAHPKAHGCVRAEFQVSDTLPVGLSHGVFVPGARYPAWIRFSNGSQDATRPDNHGDVRGMAIKLHGLPGTALLGEADWAPSGATQDFVLISHPVFFANDPRRYLAVVARASGDSALSKLLIPINLGLKGALIALATSRRKIANPVQTRYWSTVPYQLGLGPGRQAVKYSVRACSAAEDSIPANPGPNFLRDALRTTLQKRDVCMEFLLQPRTSPALSVEDSMTEWKESEAPFFKVATIRIPSQAFDTPEQNAFCEKLSFNPWHALPEHRPLGSTNRLRKVIYENISRVRHEIR